MSSTSPLDLFPVASIVELHGLLSAPQHNGRKGVVVGVAASERISVRLEESETEVGGATNALLSVKPSNVRIVSESGVSLGLRILSRVLVNDSITKMQSKVGTEEFDPVAYEALYRQQAKYIKNDNKASAHEPNQLCYLTHVSQDIDRPGGFFNGFVSYTASGPVIPGMPLPLGVPPNFHLKQAAYLERWKTTR
jgi:hypothetical protein